MRKGGDRGKRAHAHQGPPRERVSSDLCTSLILQFATAAIQRCSVLFIAAFWQLQSSCRVTWVGCSFTSDDKKADAALFLWRYGPSSEPVTSLAMPQAECHTPRLPAHPVNRCAHTSCSVTSHDWTCERKHIMMVYHNVSAAPNTQHLIHSTHCTS
jgi:hypothetical protein